jgi:hypothetical protein
MYKKHRRHHEDAEPTNNDEEKFTHKVFNFMIKLLEYIM